MKTKHQSVSTSLLGFSGLLVRGFCAGSLAFAPSVWADTLAFPNPESPNPGTTYTWTVPANVSAVTIECRGGGGAGGSALAPVNNNARGGGGAGGSYAKTLNYNVTSGQELSVTVGAGGQGVTGLVSTDGGLVLPVQIGGTSKVTLGGTDISLAIGGQGGLNAYANGGNSNRAGSAGSSTGNTGSPTYKGGKGGNSGFNYSGAGGGGAGNAGDAPAASDNQPPVNMPFFGAGGNSGGGSGGFQTLTLNTNGNPGNAPGGGGSGAMANNQAGTYIGGAGGAGSVLLTWTVDAGTTQYVVTSAVSSVPVGSSFDVTITAKDAGNNTVTSDTNVITMSSPDSGSLMEFSWDGDNTFGDNSGTLDAGVKVIKARNKKAQTVNLVADAGPVTTPIPLGITTTAGAFSKLQLLVPGETAAAGTDTGKEGAPTTRAVGGVFDVTVNAVDDFWNLIDTVIDTVSITSLTDGGATLPANAPLAAGMLLQSVTLNTPGLQTLTVSDFSDPTKTANTSTNLSVTAVGRTWAGNPNNLWDFTTANWAGLTFADLNAVTFGNTGAGAVDINGGTVAPFSMLVNASEGSDYEFYQGSITGMAGGLTKAAAGILVLDTNNTYTGPTTVIGGLLRLKNINALPTTSALTLSTGILGLESGDFTRTVGTAPGQVVLTAANGGFAAFEADRFVNLGGISAQVTWGTGGFFNAGNNLTLGHVFATHTLEFQNPININADDRIITVPDGGADVDAIISGAITNSGANKALQKAGDGTLMLTGVNAWGNELRILGGKVMLGGSTGTVIGDTSNVQLSGGGTVGDLIFDLNGRSETIAILNLGGQNTSTPPGASGNEHSAINSGAPAVLTVNGLTYFAYATDPLANQNGQATVSADIHTGTGNKNFTVYDSLYDDGNGALVEEVVISGALTGASITKLQAGNLVLTNPLYSGNTTVSAGTLIVRKTGVQTNANPNNDASTVTIAETGAVLNLDYTGTDTVASLVVEPNPPVGPGTYGAAQYPGIITGSGTITVAPPSSDLFLAWADNNPSVLFDGDENNDGVKNGLAWLLGAANPNEIANGLLPVVTQTAGSLKMTFDMLPVSVRDGAQLFVEHGNDLGIGDLWSVGVLVPDSTDGTPPVTFTVTDIDLVNPNNKLDVEASVSSTEAAAGRLFGRLRAER